MLAFVEETLFLLQVPFMDVVIQIRQRGLMKKTTHAYVQAIFSHTELALGLHSTASTHSCMIYGSDVGPTCGGRYLA